MPVKRSRIGRSSIFIDAAVMLPPPVRTKVPAVGKEELSGETWGGLLTVSSPVKGGEVARSGSGFLERCYGCKKEIGEDADVFMYSYLRAFCSVECRERQISIDNVAEVVSKASKGGTT